MKHDQFREWLMLSLYGELDPLQKETLDEHCKECADCRAEIEHLKAFQQILAQRKAVEVNDTLLAEARRQFRTALMEERSKKSILGSITEAVAHSVRRPVGIAFGGVAVFALGILLGYSALRPTHPAEQSMTETMVEQASSVQSGSRIANVRFLEFESRDGSIDLSFDAVMPVRLHGNINDQRIQKILTYALMSSQNPGIRLQTANMLSSQTTSAATRDNDTKNALITAMETDENPGVRREALAGLQKFSCDDQIKRAYLSVLMKDKNSGMRIEVINALTRVRAEGLSLDSDVISVMQNKKQTDGNAYIRTRATSFLEGVQQ
jgi:hypothetical protein